MSHECHEQAKAAIRRRLHVPLFNAMNDLPDDLPLSEQAKMVEDVVNGDRLKTFTFPAMDGLQLDLFIASPERFGVVFALRTGPADFSKALVTPRNKGGRLAEGLMIHDARVWQSMYVITGMVGAADGYTGYSI